MSISSLNILSCWLYPKYVLVVASVNTLFVPHRMNTVIHFALPLILAQTHCVTRTSTTKPSDICHFQRTRSHFLLNDHTSQNRLSQLASEKGDKRNAVTPLSLCNRRGLRGCRACCVKRKEPLVFAVDRFRIVKNDCG